VNTGDKEMKKEPEDIIVTGLDYLETVSLREFARRTDYSPAHICDLLNEEVLIRERGKLNFMENISRLICYLQFECYKKGHKEGLMHSLGGISYRFKKNCEAIKRGIA